MTTAQSDQKSSRWRLAQFGQLWWLSVLGMVAPPLGIPQRTDAAWCKALGDCLPAGRQIAMIVDIGRGILLRNPPDEKLCGAELDGKFVRRRDALECLQSQVREVELCDDERLKIAVAEMSRALKSMAEADSRRGLEAQRLSAIERSTEDGCLTDDEWNAIWKDNLAHLASTVASIQAAKNLVRALVAGNSPELSDRAWYDMQVATFSSCDANRWEADERRQLAKELCEIKRILSVKQVEEPKDDQIIWR
jgi:hypothetical protein